MRDRMWRLIEEGGWGAYPPLLVGALTVLVAVAHAVTLRRNLVPLLVAFGVVTVLSGGIGFIAGVRVVLMHGYERSDYGVLLLGMKESTSPLLIGLVLPSLAGLVAVVGGFRIAMRAAPTAEEP